MYVEFNKRGKRIHSSSSVPTEWLILLEARKMFLINPDTEWLKGGSARLSTKCLDRII